MTRHTDTGVIREHALEPSPHALAAIGHDHLSGMQRVSNSDATPVVAAEFDATQYPLDAFFFEVTDKLSSNYIRLLDITNCREDLDLLVLHIFRVHADRWLHSQHRQYLQ